MTRRLLIAANWKMNKTIEEAHDFADKFNEKEISEVVDVLVCGPFMSLPVLSALFENGRTMVGAENVHFEEKGAFTGEVSAEMVKEVCSHVIIGHSERREYFNETNEIVNKKIKKALEHDLQVVFCCGESLEQREKGETNDFVAAQIKEALLDITAEQMKNITVAYEPIWAIGTGKVATPEQAEEVHGMIRSLLKELYSDELAESTRILYGGSMKPENAKELLSQKNIDGGLVGGASLDPDSFAEICNSG